MTIEHPPQNEEQRAYYDKQVAKQVEFLKKHNLIVRILGNEVIFQKRPPRTSRLTGEPR